MCRCPLRCAQLAHKRTSEFSAYVSLAPHQSATQQKLVPLDPYIELGQRLAEADVIFLGPYDDGTKDVRTLLSRVNGSVVFMSGENAGQDKDYSFVGYADASFSPRNDVRDPTHMRLPCWLPTIIEDGNCTLPETLSKPSSADAWRARGKFATMLVSHETYPRRELFELLGNISTVDCPNGPFKNIDWPTHAFFNECGSEFRQPILSPGAREWVWDWCSRAREHLANAASRKSNPRRAVGK